MAIFLQKSWKWQVWHMFDAIFNFYYLIEAELKDAKMKINLRI